MERLPHRSDNFNPRSVEHALWLYELRRSLLDELGVEPRLRGPLLDRLARAVRRGAQSPNTVLAVLRVRSRYRRYRVPTDDAEAILLSPRNRELALRIAATALLHETIPHWIREAARYERARPYIERWRRENDPEAQMINWLRTERGSI